MDSNHGPAISMTPAAIPSNDTSLHGQYITLEALSQYHAVDLWYQLGFDEDKSILEWLPWAVPNSADELWDVFEKLRLNRGFIIFAILGDPEHVNPTSSNPPAEQCGKIALGTIGYLDYNTAHRTLEVGAVLFGKALRRSAAATEAHYLLLRNIFSPPSHTPAYRRAAWKNNSLNTASRRAAERVGYVYEGTFRNHMISQGRSRDSDWLSIVDDEWPIVKTALEGWLGGENFDGVGKQRRKLEDIRAKLVEDKRAG